MQNQIKDFILRNARLLILLLLSVLGVILYLASRSVNSPLSDLLINLCASSFMAIITIFGVDFLLGLHNRRKWREAEQVAKDDLIHLSDMMVTYIAIPLGFNPLDYSVKDKKVIEVNVFKAIDTLLDDLKNINLDKSFSLLPNDKWKHLEINLLFLRPSITEAITTYDDVLTPELFGKFLKVKKTFNDFYFQFGLINVGWDDKSLVAEYLKAPLGDYLQKYLDATKQLRKELWKW